MTLHREVHSGVSTIHKKLHLEDEICADLAAAGWLCEAGDNARYDRMQEQFANSPDLTKEIMGAVMDALTAHTAMSKQALESAQLRADMKDVLLGAGKLWEGLRAKSASAAPPG